MQKDSGQMPKTDWAGLMHVLGRDFAERAERCDANDAFVAENFAELKERGVLAAGVPAELGGGDASYAELCEMLRVLARALRLDRTLVVDAHASTGDAGLALAPRSDAGRTYLAAYR